MSPGSKVWYLARPNWGVGVIQDITPNGRLTVSFDDVPYEGEFAAHELEDAYPAQPAMPAQRLTGPGRR